MLGKKKTSFGLDIGTHSIKCVQLEKKDNAVSLKNSVIKKIYGQDQKYDAEKEDLSKIVSILTDTFKEMKVSPKKVKNLVASLTSNAVNVKHIRTVPLTTEELENSIRFEARKHMPISGSEMILDFQILDLDNEEDDNSEMDVLLVVTNQKAFQRHIAIINGAGADAGVVDVDILANMNSYLFFNTPRRDELLVFLNIGAERTNLAVYDPAGLFFTRNLSYGGNHFSTDLMREYEVEFDVAERIKVEKGLFIKEEKSDDKSIKLGGGISIGEKPSYESLVDEIQRSLRYYFKECGKNNFGKILLTGGSALVAGFDEYLSNELNIATEVYNPFRLLEDIPDNIDHDSGPQLAQAIGLALRFD